MSTAPVFFGFVAEGIGLSGSKHSFGYNLVLMSQRPVLFLTTDLLTSKPTFAVRLLMIDLVGSLRQVNVEFISPA